MILSADIPLRLANCNLHSGIAPGPATPPHVAVAFPHSARATTFEDMQSPVAFRHSTRSCPWRSSFQYVSQTPFCATYRLWTFPGYFRTLALAAVSCAFSTPSAKRSVLKMQTPVKAEPSLQPRVFSPASFSRSRPAAVSSRETLKNKVLGRHVRHTMIQCILMLLLPPVSASQLIICLLCGWAGDMKTAHWHVSVTRIFLATWVFPGYSSCSQHNACLAPRWGDQSFADMLRSESLNCLTSWRVKFLFHCLDPTGTNGPI